MVRGLSPSSQTLPRGMPRSAGLVFLPNGDSTRDWLNSVVHSNSHRGTRLRMIYWRQSLFILVNLKKQRSWHDKRLNMTHWPIKPVKAWLASFLSRESLMTLKPQRGRRRSCSQRRPDAADGRYLWRSRVAMARRPCAKLNLNLTNAINVS